jgi:hypothetical protein
MLRYGWSLEARDWSRALELWNGPWKRVPFKRVQLSAVPEGTGIYAICGGVPGAHDPKGVFKELYSALYVGQSLNLRQRFVTHNDSPKPEIKRVLELFRSLMFWYLELPAVEIDAAEDALIACFGPAANLRRGIRARIQKDKAMTI